MERSEPLTVPQADSYCWFYCQKLWKWSVAGCSLSLLLFIACVTCYLNTCIPQMDGRMNGLGGWAARGVCLDYSNTILKGSTTWRLDTYPEENTSLTQNSALMWGFEARFQDNDQKAAPLLKLQQTSRAFEFESDSCQVSGETNVSLNGVLKQNMTWRAGTITFTGWRHGGITQ